MSEYWLLIEVIILWYATNCGARLGHGQLKWLNKYSTPLDNEEIFCGGGVGQTEKLSFSGLK